MRTEIENNRKTKRLYISIKATVLLLFIAGITSYFSPSSALNAVYEFEKHHLFLFCFISLAIFLLFLKLYMSIVEKEGMINRKLSYLKMALLRKENAYSEAEEIVIHKNITKSTMIDKAEAKSLMFENSDALQSEELRLSRERELKKAMVLGNSYKHKVKLFIKDVASLKHIETTVWFVDENYVTLKEGILVPKRSIYKVVA